MQRLRNWAKDKLGIARLQSRTKVNEDRLQKRKHEIEKLQDEIQRVEASNRKVVAESTAALDKARSLSQTAANLMQRFGLAVDVNPIGGDSWAVLCIKGTQRVHFVPLHGADGQAIERFIRQFEETNKIIDAPYGAHRRF